jgi:hypothetical protein
MITIDIVLSVCALMHSIGIVHIHCKPINNAERQGHALKRLCAYVSDPKLRNRGDAEFVISTCHHLMAGTGLSQARPKKYQQQRD